MYGSTSDSIDKMCNRYESIKTVTEPAQKEKGQLGGQSTLMAANWIAYTYQARVPLPQNVLPVQWTRRKGRKK